MRAILWGVSPVAAGAVCFAAAVMPAAVLSYLAYRVNGDASQIPSGQVAPLDLTKLIVVRVIAVPAIENFLFPIVLFILTRWRLAERTVHALFLFSFLTLGFLLHGGGMDDVGKSFAFALLAQYYWITSRASNWIVGLFALWGAHATWNLLTVLGVLFYR
jgi:hypothetical protein